MKPKAPKKRNPKPNCKSGEVKQSISIEKQYELFCVANQSLMELYRLGVTLLKIKD